MASCPPVGRSCKGGYPSRNAVRDERATRCATRHCGLSTTRAQSLCPDERDTQPGRERPNPGRPSGEVGGSRNRVAHAPAASKFHLADCCRLLARHKTPRGLPVATAFLLTTC